MSDDVNTGEQKISFTIKELLARQDLKLDTIIVEIRDKADRHEMNQLSGRVSALEMVVATAKGGSSMARWIVPILVSAVAIAVPAIIALLGRS